MMPLPITKTSPLSYDCAGDGPDLLLVHGWGSSRQMWDAPVRHFSEMARCWAVDLPGFGDSPPCDAFASNLYLDRYTDMLAEFCAHHAIRPKAVIGHSMGGMLALKLALAYPDLMERLVLVCPVVTGGFLAFGVGRAARWPLIAAAMVRSRRLWQLARSRPLAPLMALPWVTNPSVKGRVSSDLQRISWPTAALCLISLASENLQPRLHEIQQPTLVLVGTRDITVPAAEGRLAARLMPHARLVEFPRTFHQLVDEQPRRFREVVQSFLYGTDGNHATMPHAEK